MVEPQRGQDAKEKRQVGRCAEYVEETRRMPRLPSTSPEATGKGTGVSPCGITPQTDNRQANSSRRRFHFRYHL